MENAARIEFLSGHSAFSVLSREVLQKLAARLHEEGFAAGSIVIQQGEDGDCCYLVRKGRVEIIQKDDGSSRQITTLGAGTLFGEAALLTESTRNATVRTLEPSEFLVLKRSDFLEVLRDSRQLSVRIFELLSLRDRPNRLWRAVHEQQITSDGSVVTILKDPVRNTYYRLSNEGWFLWQKLDGLHNLKDLTLSYFDKFRKFVPHTVAEIVGGLVVAGFAESRTTKAKHLLGTDPVSRRQRLIGFVRGILEWKVIIRGVDPFLTRLYQKGARYLYTWPAKLVMASIALSGLILSVFHWDQFAIAVGQAFMDKRLLLVFIPASLLVILSHEAGHAFTTKYFGREVISVGFGWYWFGPIFFVDTSDMWLSGRWPRIAVSLSGVYANLVLAGLAALIGWQTSNPSVATVSWLFVLGSYLVVLMSLNPLLKYDGYYVLQDLLKK